MAGFPAGFEDAAFGGSIRPVTRGPSACSAGDDGAIGFGTRGLPAFAGSPLLPADLGLGLGILAAPDEVIIIDEASLLELNSPLPGFSDPLALTGSSLGLPGFMEDALESCGPGHRSRCGAAGYKLYKKVKKYYDYARYFRDFGLKPGGFYVQEVAGRRYIILKGYPGLRKTLRGTRMLATNPKLVKIGLGVGSFRHMVRSGAVTVAIVGAGYALDALTAWWLADEQALDEIGRTWAPTLTKEIIKSLVSAGAGVLAGSLFAGAGIVILPLTVSIVAGIAVGAILDSLEEDYILEELFRRIRSELP